MGNGASKGDTQNTKMVSNVVNESIATSVQSCASEISGSQEMDIGGFCLLCRQKSDLSIDSACLGDVTHQTGFTSDVATDAAQQLEKETIGGLQWLDQASKQNTFIHGTLVNSVNSTDVQTCYKKINSAQKMTVMGIAIGAGQTSIASLTGDCMKKSGQFASAVNTVSESSAQHLKDVTVNPLDFIADALKAAASSAYMVIAIALIALVILAVVYKAMASGPAARPPGVLGAAARFAPL